MSKRKPDAQAKRVVERAEQFRRARLSREADLDAPFLLELAGEEELWVGAIHGAVGGRPGLVLFRGAASFGQLRDHAESALLFPIDSALIDLDFETWSKVEPEFGGLHRKAGLTGNRTRLVPVVAVRESGGGDFRPPRDREVRVLSAALGVMLGAAKKGEFEPTRVLNSAGEVLRIRGGPGGRFEGGELIEIPTECMDYEPPVIVDLGEGLAEFPRLDQATWIMGALPASECGDDHDHDDEDDEDYGKYDVVVVEAESGEELSEKQVSSDPVSGLWAAFDHACRRAGGLPVELLFMERRLFRAVEASLARLGIAGVYDPLDPRLRGFDDMAHLRYPCDPEAVEPEAIPTEAETWDDWLEADCIVRDHLVAEMSRQIRAGEPIREEFFGEGSGAVNLGHRMVRDAVAEWFAGDRRSGPGAPTFVEDRLSDSSLSYVERSIYESRRDALVTIVRVKSVVPGVELELVDEFTGREWVIRSPQQAVPEIAGQVVPARLCPLGDEFVVLMAAPPIDPDLLSQVMDEFEYREPLGIRHQSTRMGSLFRLLFTEKDCGCGGGEVSLRREDAEMMVGFLRSSLLGWLDEKIPALGGLTPREAVKTDEWREGARDLVESMRAPVANPEVSALLDFESVRERLRRELGLDQQG